MPYPTLTDKRLKITSGTTQTHYIYFGDNTYSIPAAGTGVTFTDNNPSANWVRIQVNGTTASDATYDFGDINVYVDVITLSTSVTSVTTCCDTDTLYLAWFNRWGGWQSWAFRRKRTFTIEIGSEAAQTYVSGITKKYASMGDVYEGEIVEFEIIDRDQIDSISRMLYSLQVFAWNSTTEEFDIPVLIDRQSFNKYSNSPREKVVKMSFKFIYADKLAIQTA